MYDCCEIISRNFDIDTEGFESKFMRFIQFIAQNKSQISIREAFKNHPDLRVITQNASCIVTFTSETLNCIAMAEEMKKRRRWTVLKAQRPPSMQLCITDSNSANWEDFIDAVNECVAAMKADPSLNTNASTALYGLTGAIPDPRFLRQFVCYHQAAMLDTLE